MPRKVIIVGAGPVGSLLGIFLADRGNEVEIFERRPDPRLAGDREGRSINLALSRRGFDALEPAGLKEQIMALATPMKGRVIHPVSGALGFQPYGKDDSEVIYAVSRGALNRALLTAAEAKPGITIHFDRRCMDIDIKARHAVFRNEVSGISYQAEAETFFGADGSSSVVRLAMSRIPRISTSQQFIEYGYKELTIPAGTKGEFQFEKNALHIWPRGGYMLIALPNLDGSFTCTLFFPFEGEESFNTLNHHSAVDQFFARVFPDAARLIPDLSHRFLANPTGALATIAVHPWHIEDTVMVVGDAAHGIVPFLGQGLNCALESVVLLVESLDRSQGNWSNAFKAFNQGRKADADAIAEMALDNFIEMRDRVADPKFLLKKQVELQLEKRFYPRFIGRYAMIQFHRTPYRQALERGRINESILNELCEKIDLPDDLDWKKAENLIDNYLSNLG